MQNSGGGRTSDPAGMPVESAGLTRRELLTGMAATAALLAQRRALAAGSTRVFRIHPAIGVARVGNAPADTGFLGPEAPGVGPTEVNGDPVENFKVAGQVRPQAARFRVYEYADFGAGLVPFREITARSSGVKDIVWTVHVANRKSAFHRYAGPAGEEYDPIDQRIAQPSSTLRNPSVSDRASLETDFGPRTLSAAAYNKGGAAQAFESSSVPKNYPATWPVDA